jgi:hypothetical protein
MKLYVDIDSQEIISSPGVPQALSTLTIKRAGLVRLDVQFCRAGQIVELIPGATGIFELKPFGKYDADPVSGDSVWEQVGSGSDTIYQFLFSLLTEDLNALLAVNSNIEDDKTLIKLMGELQWYDGAEHTSQTLTVFIENNVIRVGDVIPPGAAPVDYLVDDTDPSSPEIMFDLDSGEPLTVQ